MENVPNEILFHIVSFFRSEKDYHNFSSCCKLFHAVCHTNYSNHILLPLIKYREKMEAVWANIKLILQNYTNEFTPAEEDAEIYEPGIKIEPGTHIAFYSPTLGAYHHGIHNIKDHRPSIIHFYGDSITDMRLREDFLFDMNKSKPLYIYRTTNARCESALEMANDFLIFPELAGKYHILTNNCESFATFCHTGKKESKQIQFGISLAMKVTNEICNGSFK